MHNIADKIKEEARIAACRAESTKAFVLKQNRDQNQNLPRNSTIPAQPNKASSSVQTTQRFNPYERTPCPPKCVPTPVAPYVYTCVCKFSMISAHPKRFVVDNNRFNVELVDACKTFKTKSYGKKLQLKFNHNDSYQSSL